MKKYILILIVLIAVATGGYFGYLCYLSSQIRTTPLVNPDTASSTSYSLLDISAHSVASDCWTTVDEKVYNLTSFIPSHPGGNAILPACGTDGTALFGSVRQHGQVDAQATLYMYQIGILAR